MSDLYNVYCDESCHLENDHQKVMVLGAVWCPISKRREIADRIRDIKIKHSLSAYHEVKWTNVSPAKIDFYQDLIDFFFDDDDLHFRALVIPDKSKINHAAFGQDHDLWYYKMYFNMLKTIFCPHDRYRVYIDIKDTLGGEKIRKLHDVLCNNLYDFSKNIVESVKLVDSQEIQQMQLADLLIGAVMYANRGEFNSEAKKLLVDRIKQRSRYSLIRTTLPKENKFNLLIWQSNGRAI
jgi:hypothetical protein